MKDSTSERYAIGADIGGTSIRSGLVNARGAIRRGSYQVVQVDSKGSKESVLRALTDPFRRNLAQAREEGLRVAAIGTGMCGPLDYARGICLIRGVDKYETLYGTDLKSEFRHRLKLSNSFPIQFEVDAWSFGRGEVWRGLGRGYRRVVALTIGSGLGSAFLIDGIPYGEGPGVPPPYGWVGGLPFGGGILDDRVSRRGIRAHLRSMASDRKSEVREWDVKDIAKAAQAGDRTCLQVFEETGEALGRTIAPNLDAFKAECLVVGGRIGQALPVFEKTLRRRLASVSTLERIAPARSVRYSALWGAAKMAFSQL